MNKSLNILARIREEISDIFGFYFTSGVICLKIDPFGYRFVDVISHVRTLSAVL
ncbi:hypothetical protein AB8890_20085 [Yersinia enterocolitica]|uniref:hypothetical protein n=1 Tax=Yersinia enterocolitica TaxID=630 RepID=UPI003D027174